MPMNVIEYINNFIRQNTKFVNFYHHVFIPDEMFFQTILMNSPFSNQVENNPIHYINWNPKRYPLPVVFGKEDFDAIKNSNKLFARKFDMNFDSEILDLIDNEILNNEK